MVRVSLLPLFASPAASAVRLSLIPTLFLSSSSSSSFSFSSSCCPPSLIHRLSTFAPLSNFLPKTLILNSSSHFFRRVPSMVGHPWPKGTILVGSIKNPYLIFI
uniref:Rhodanese-like/PpiC domain-containing protein 12 n=1 Tax=Rhizophora mucronata TaxID=61149 RepID=A0A2P2MEU3_RHIMU